METTNNKLTHKISRSIFIDFPNLTYTNFRAIELLLQGLTNKQIADKEFVQETSIKQRLLHVYKIFDVKSRSQLIIFLLNNGYVVEVFDDFKDEIPYESFKEEEEEVPFLPRGSLN